MKYLGMNTQFLIFSLIDNFSFVVATDKIEPTVFIANRFAGKTVHKKASMAWLENYMQTRTAPLIEK